MTEDVDAAPGVMKGAQDTVRLLVDQEALILVDANSA